MKVSVLQENLKATLALVSKAISPRHSLPVLGNVLLEAKDGRLHVVGTNLETMVHCTVSAKVEQDGAITVPAKSLIDYVNGLLPLRVDMEAAVKTQSLTLACGAARAVFKGIDYKDFPVYDFPLGGEGDALIDAGALAKAIDHTAFSASTDESRRTFTGINISMEEAPDLDTAAQGWRTMKFVATDGYRLGVSKHLAQGMLPEGGMIIPAKGLAIVAKTAAEGDQSQRVRLHIEMMEEEVKGKKGEKETRMVARRAFWEISGNSDSRGFSTAVISQQIIDAKMPAYEAIIPKNKEVEVEVDTAAFIKAVGQATVFGRDNANIVDLHILPNSVLVAAQSTELGESENRINATRTIPSDEIDSSFSIAFNAKYLVDALKALPGAAVMTFTKPTRPCTIEATGKERGSYLQVIMPMHPPQREPASVKASQYDPESVAHEAVAEPA